MADFEGELMALFDQARPSDDAEAFAGRVQARIARRLWLRAALVTAMGLLGAVAAWRAIGVTAADLSDWAASALALVVGRMNLANQAFWLAVMLAAVVAVLTAQRVFEEG